MCPQASLVLEPPINICAGKAAAMAAAAVSRGALKPVGHTQVHGSRGHVPKGGGGAGWCHCKAALDHLGNARANKEFSGGGKRPPLPPFSIRARRSMQGTAGWSATSESLAGGWSKFLSLIPWPTSVSSCCLRCPGVAEVPICCSETGPRTSGSPSGAFAGHQEKYLQTPPLRQLLSLH